MEIRQDILRGMELLIIFRIDVMATGIKIEFGRLDISHVAAKREINWTAFSTERSNLPTTCIWSRQTTERSVVQSIYLATFQLAYFQQPVHTRELICFDKQFSNYSSHTVV